MTRARDLSPRGRRSWLRSVAILGLAVAPAIGVGARALAGEPRGKRHDRGRDADESGETVEQARKRVLASMPVDAASLINVGGRELPASPDVLALGRRGVTALTRCLADNTDADVRRRCAAMLGRIGDKRALPAMHAALDDWEPSVRTAVATALERMPDPSSVAPLVKLFARKDEEDANRVVVLRALGAETHRSAVAVLRQVLADKDAAHELKLTAFQGVWRSRHVMARETLVSDVGAALGSPNDDLVIAAVVAAAELRSPRLTAALTPLLDHKNANVRNKAVYALGLIGDRAATKTLLAKLPSVRDGRMLNNIAFALERLDREAFFTSVRELVQHKQAVIRLNAAFVLGDVKRPDGLGMLEGALGDASDLVKASVVQALGKIGDAREIPRLEKLVTSENLALREEAVHAIFAIAGPKRADLVYDVLFTGKKEEPKRRAALALGEIGDRRVRDYLLRCLEARACREAEVDRFLHLDGDPSTGGRLLLAWARGRDDLSNVVEELRPTGALPVVTAAMDASIGDKDAGDAAGTEHTLDLVGAFGDASARTRLAAARDAHAPALEDPWVEIHAQAALARLGDPSAEAWLFARMDVLAADLLPRFASVVGRIDGREVRARMAPELVSRERGDDADIALAAASVRLGWDPEAAIGRFLSALGAERGRERELADHYLVRAHPAKVTWLLRAALARETRADVKDRLRDVLDRRPAG